MTSVMMLRTRAWSILSLLLVLAGAHAATTPNLNVIVSSETAPPGATVQIKLSLAKPAAVSTGELALDLDPTIFGPVSAIATFSAAGDGSGFAFISGSHIDIHFASLSATLGSAAGMPLVVITVPTLATAKPGAQATITADASGSPWTGPLVPGAPGYPVTVTPGTVTIGGTLSVSDVSPVSNLAAGAVVRINGTGFTSATTVDIAAASVASVQLVGPQEIDVTLAGAADLGGKQIRVRNPGGSQVTFFAAPPAQPLPAVGDGGDGFDGAIPLFPTASYPAGGSAIFTGLSHARYALVNPNAAPVDVLLQGSVQMTLTIPAGSAFYTDSRKVGNEVQVIATAPLQMLQLVALVSGATAELAGYNLSPFTPTGIPPLGIVGPSGTSQFNWVTGAPAPQPHTVALFASGAAAGIGFGERTQVAFTVSFSTASGGDWLSVSPPSGITTASVATLTVSVNPSALLFGLGPGIYRGTVTVTPLATQFQPAGPPISFPVALTVTSSPLVNHIISLESFIGAPANRLSDTIPITPDILPGPFSVGAITDSGGNWLSATPLSGTTPAQLTVAATPGNLAPGTYAGVVTVAGSGGNSLVIESTLTVLGGVQLYTTGLNPVFALGPGEPPSGPQTVPVQVPCPSSPCTVPNNVTWTTTTATHSGGNWLHASSSFNTTGPGGSVTISVDPVGLATGVYTGVVTLTSDQATPAQIPVALNVWSGPVPALLASSNIVPAANPAAVSLTSAPFAAPVANAAVLCTTTGSANVRQTAQATTSNGGNWLSITVFNDVTGSCGIALSFDASHLNVGTYQGDVRISVQGQSLDVPVTLTIPAVSLTGGQPVLGSVLNAASAIQGAIAPGEIITIHGNFGFNDFGGGAAPGVSFMLDSQGRVPTSLNDTEILINGKPAPLLYASASQVNAIVPYEVAGQTAATVQALFYGLSQVWSIPVAPAAPGIFTLDSTGAGPAAVLNQDNSVNGPTQPAARGTVIQIFATGIPVRGAVTGSVTPTAAPGSTDPVSVAIGGVTAPILYAGPAPGEIAGLVQVNAVVPDIAPTGPAIPIVLSVSPPQGPLLPIIYASQAGLTIAVQ
jgi:uncharacterized protein (TIGR03437 family)